MASYHVFLFDSDGVRDWISAPDMRAAVKVHLDTYGDLDHKSAMESMKITQKPDEEMLTLADSFGGGPDESKPCGEWAAAHPNSIFGSTEV